VCVRVRMRSIREFVGCSEDAPAIRRGEVDRASELTFASSVSNTFASSRNLRRNENEMKMK